MSIGFGQILLILIGVLMVFGAGRLPTVMADLAKGIRAFKKGLTEEEESSSVPNILTHIDSSKAHGELAEKQAKEA
jgi:sec-independent protein translocase protein TatA